MDRTAGSILSITWIVLFLGLNGCKGETGPAGPQGQPGDEDVCSILDFIPDNVTTETTDCTAYIQDAINSGKDIFFPSGTYRTTSPLSLATRGQTLWGQGKIVTSASRAFVTNVALYDVSIRGLTLTNLGESAGGNNSAIGIYSEPNGIAGFERSAFSELKLIGFGIGFSISGIADDSLLYGPDGRNLISQCEVRSTLARSRIGSGGGHGIYLRGGYFQVVSNRVDSMQGGILAPTYGVVANNLILNAWDDNGIYVAGGVSVSVSGNYIENTKADGIAVSSAQRISVVGNTIINAGSGSIRVQSSDRITITGNTCRAAGASNHFIRGYADGTHDGCHEILISDNIFQGPTSQQSNPVVFVPGTSPHRGIIIADNIFYDLDTAPLSSQSFGPYAIINIRNSLDGSIPESCIVRGNLFSNVVQVPGCPEAYIRGASEVGDNLFIYR
jgi:parallel beta-helix repeat protein